MLSHGPESMFSDDFSDGHMTHIDVCATCGLFAANPTTLRSDQGTACRCDDGPIPTQEMEEEIMIDEAVPEFIDPRNEITRPMARNVLGQYEQDFSDEPTLVEPVYRSKVK